MMSRHNQALSVGLAVRLGLLILAVPQTYVDWFVPFLTHAAHLSSVDAWTSFLATGGDPRAFPYGPLYLAYLPLTALGSLAGPRGAALGLGVTVLVLDIALFRILRQLVEPEKRAPITYAYWLSPVVIYICYWHGQLDVLPVLLLSGALALLQRRKSGGAGAALGLAVAAKLSMAIAIPFAWIYMVAARRLRSQAARLISSTLAGSVIIAPFLLSPGFRQMVLHTPEAGKIFSLAITYGELTVYVTPLVLAGLVLAAWRIRRFNFDILFSLIGIAFFVVFLLTPASPGWAMWLIPFLACLLARSGRNTWAVYFGFAALFVAFHLMTASGALTALHLPFKGLSPRGLNLLLSLYLAAGGILAAQLLRQGILRNPFYRASRTPLTIAIAGDSGAGKDTLSDGLQAIFGAASTATISGDDYHSWDRHKPMWRALTHLNPAANNLRRFSADVLSLRAGRPVSVPHYDHRIGRMTKPLTIEATDVIIASGLHALHSPELNAALDLGIFLAMDEELRLFLKIRRDVRVRGHSLEAVRASLAKREPDSARYIRPQADNAHLILSLVPLNRRELIDPLGGPREIRMALLIEARATADLSALERALIALLGLDVLPHPAREGRVGLLVSGDAEAMRIGRAATTTFPELADYLAVFPQWSGGLMGVMQLAILNQIGQTLALGKGS
jgi:uridine kinase